MLSILGLSSIVQGIVVWSGFIREAVNIYTKYFRGSIVLIFEKIKPDFIPPIPTYVYDIIVIWACSFIVIRIFMALENEPQIIVHRSMMRWTFYPKMFLLGPLAPFYLRTVTSGRITYERESTLKEIDEDNKENILNELGKDALRKRMRAIDDWIKAAKKVYFALVYYYAAAIVVFCLILFINYQFLIA